MAQNLIWVFPDRGTRWSNTRDDRYFWQPYTDAAAAVGYELQVVAPEAIEIFFAGSGSPQVVVGEKPVRPADTVFVTEVYTFPHQAQDIWNQVTTYALLEQAGFYLPIPSRLAILTNDKMATYLYLRAGGLAVQSLPSCRITPGRDLTPTVLLRVLEHLPLPLIVKPLSWGSGLGVNVARTASDLENLLGLAGGANTGLVLQPCLSPEQLVDYRVYVIEGQPHTALARRPKRDSVIANLSRGGRVEVVEVPTKLAALVGPVAKLLDVPYTCIDFLFDGEHYWFSEIELDGAIAYVDEAQAHRVLMDRFLAYRRAHERLLQHGRLVGAQES